MVVDVIDSESVFAGPESLFHILQPQTVQRQHVFAVILFAVLEAGEKRQGQLMKYEGKK